MKEKLISIISHYGINNQQRKLQEEVFELQQAIFEYQNGGFLSDLDYEEKEKEYINHIEEELGDVQVMLKQIQYFYGITDGKIEKVMEFKVDRQLERMKSE